MTDYESTLLAGIPNGPILLCSTVSQELAARRQQQVLDRLVKCGYFTEERALEPWRLEAAGDDGNMTNR